LEWRLRAGTWQFRLHWDGSLSFRSTPPHHLENPAKYAKGLIDGYLSCTNVPHKSRSLLRDILSIDIRVSALVRPSAPIFIYFSNFRLRLSFVVVCLPCYLTILISPCFVVEHPILRPFPVKLFLIDSDVNLIRKSRICRSFFDIDFGCWDRGVWPGFIESPGFF
jgi:hypothetical protein